jgi:hypothetical protein
MPRRLRRWARAVAQRRAPLTVSAERPKPDAAMQIDLTSARDRDRDAAGQALAVPAAGGGGGAGAAGAAGGIGERRRGGTSVAERRQEWAERELAVRSVLADT